MTVRKLIERLNKLDEQTKDKPIFIFSSNKLYHIHMIDSMPQDRVDLNVELELEYKRKDE